LFPDTEFVFDLELPPDFVPRNQDNEVEKFELVTASVSIYFLYILQSNELLFGSYEK